MSKLALLVLSIPIVNRAVAAWSDFMYPWTFRRRLQLARERRDELNERITGRSLHVIGTWHVGHVGYYWIAWSKSTRTGRPIKFREFAMLSLALSHCFDQWEGSSS